MSATVSAPRRDLMKASAGTSDLTSAASRSAASPVAARRDLTSPRVYISGGSHSANVSGTRGEPSSVTAITSRPVSSRAPAAGSAIVAEASTKTGAIWPSSGLCCAATRRSLRSTCATCEPKTPR